MKKNCLSLGLVLLLLSSDGFIAPALGVIRDGGIDPSNLGNGDWVFSMVDATNQLSSHVSSVTNEASLMLYYQSQGIRYFAVKAATGTNLFGDCVSGPQLNSNLVNIAHSYGILVFGYNRSYATNTAGEVAIADYVFNQGADGFIWDAEAEWESAKIGTQGPGLAWAQCSMVRSNWPNKFLAHSPFAIIALHSSFPYKEFGYWCDAVMPQVYHFASIAALKHSVSATINWTDVNWSKFQSALAVLPATNINGLAVYWTNAIKPLAPIQDVYGPTAPAPICEGLPAATPDTDLLEFLDYLSADPNAATAGGYRGALFFRTDLRDAAQWSYVKNNPLGSFAGVVNNVVLDNTAATTVGSWTTVLTFSATTNAPSFFGDGSGSDTNSFGTNYLTKTKGTGIAYVQFTPNIITAGNYDIYQWHARVTNASTNVPFVINYSGGSSNVSASQQTNAGTWSLLGRFPFAVGTAGNVRVSDAIPESSAVAVADGIKFAFAGSISLPASPSGLTATPVSPVQIDLSWVDNATNETAYLVARTTTLAAPYTNIATLFANTTSYNDVGLSPATTYYYSVRATNYLGKSVSDSEAAATTLPPPALNIVRTGTNMILSWSTNYSGYKLELRTNLNSVATWSPVPGVPAVVGTQYTVTNSASPTNRFYRLRWP